MSTTGRSIFTIGHSNHTADAFLALLHQHKVEVVADVRSSPYSKYTPHFNREQLQSFLKANDIGYVFLGNELGGRTDDPSCLSKDGRVTYAKLAETDSFKRGLERLLEGTAKYRVALMCAEMEPLECHRTLLVAKALAEHGQQVQHIHADGQIESQEIAMERLLEITRVKSPEGDLFCSEEELVSLAIAKQEAKVAYKEKDEGLESKARREAS